MSVGPRAGSAPRALQETTPPGPAREFDAPSVLSELAEGSEPCPDRRRPTQRVYYGDERY